MLISGCFLPGTVLYLGTFLDREILLVKSQDTSRSSLLVKSQDTFVLKSQDTFVIVTNKMINSTGGKSTCMNPNLQTLA
jgi:hypothetical protein